MFLRNVIFSQALLRYIQPNTTFSLPDLLEPQILLRIYILFVLICFFVFYLCIFPLLSLSLLYLLSSISERNAINPDKE
jgi:hypothetical protein